MNKKSIKKAETLNLSSLKLSKITAGCVTRRGLSPEQVVTMARKDDINFILNPAILEKTPRWRKELVCKLREAGFIKLDLFPDYGVSILYYNISASLLPDKDSNFNWRYEQMEFVTEQHLESIMEALSKGLNDLELKIVISAYGLDGEIPRGFETIAESVGLSPFGALSKRDRALRKMRHHSNYGRLPRIFGLVPREDPFKRHTPPIVKKDPATSVDKLELSVRAVSCLKRAGITTLREILKLSPDELMSVRNLGKKATEEVVEQVHKAGYINFFESLDE